MVPAVGLVLVAVFGTVPGCRRASEPVTVGVKGFAEQRVLGALLSELLASEGMRPEVLECGDSYACQRALRDGVVDLMVEYTGTALTLTGATAGPDEQMARLREVFEPFSLRWFDPLGFDNSYAVAVPTAKAAALGLTSVEDLASLDEVRITCPSSYARRSGDGLFALVRRYGLRLNGPPLIIEEPSERYRALLDGRADAAVAFATDGSLAGRRLRLLDDTLSFFPAYEGAIIARDDVLEREPRLERVLAGLAGRIDTDAMRRMNAMVQLEARPPVVVARQFLRDTGLVGDARDGETGRAELVVASHAADELGAATSEAVAAIRDAFVNRTVRLRTSDAPVEDVARGRVRLAVLGAERFFFAGPDPKRQERIEAVAPVGVRAVHVIRRANDGSKPLSGRIAIPPSKSGGGIVARAMLAASGRKPVQTGPLSQQVQDVVSGRADGALVLAPTADPAVAELLAGEGRITLRSLPGWLSTGRSLRLPFLRAVRIPAGTYAGQETAIETVGAQVVIAAPAPQPDAEQLTGPGGALRVAGAPLTPEEARALADASAAGELPDPILPSPWGLRPGTRADPWTELAGAFAGRALNVLVWIFLAWLVVLVTRREPDAEAPAAPRSDRTVE